MVTISNAISIPPLSHPLTCLAVLPVITIITNNNNVDNPSEKRWSLRFFFVPVGADCDALLHKIVKSLFPGLYRAPYPPNEMLVRLAVGWGERRVVSAIGLVCATPR